jgi:hypothetical protein
LGKDERHRRSGSRQKKRSAHARRAKEAFSVNESSLGGKKEGSRNTKTFGTEKRHTYTCRSKEAFRADEGALGSEKEIRVEVAIFGS